MERLLQDLKYSLRVLRQQRAFTIAAVAALALGIGATTAVFSVVNAILLRPFPYPDPERIVMFMNVTPNGSNPGASPAKFAHWQRQTEVVQDPSAFRNVLLNYTGGELPEQITSGNVTEALYTQCDSTQSPIGPSPSSSRPARSISQVLITVSISE